MTDSKYVTNAKRERAQVAKEQEEIRRQFRLSEPDRIAKAAERYRREREEIKRKSNEYGYYGVLRKK